MKLSSLDIRKQVFSRAFRGYDVEDVHSYLHEIANQWQELVDKFRRSEESVKDQQLKLDHYMKVEEALEAALQTARVGARQTIDNAERKARALLDEATRQAVDIARETEIEIVSVKRETAKYSIRQTEIVAKMRAFLLSELEILAHYDGKDPSGLVKLISSESGQRTELVHDISDRAEESEVFGDIEELEEPEQLDESEEKHPSFVFESDEGDPLVDSAEADGVGADLNEAEFDNPDEALEEKARETAGTDPTEVSGSSPAWTVNPLISREPGIPASGESSPTVDIADNIGMEGVSEEREKAASEEIKKIRRILEDLEK